MLLQNELLEPIAGDNPAGANLRYHPVYDQIKLARVQEDELPQGEWKTDRKVADYALVVRLATDALKKQTKDLQIAGWLTEAWTRREGLTGLVAGLGLLRSLLEQFWDHLYPELEDGDAEFRAAPLEWVALYLGDSLRAVPLTRAGHSLIDFKESRIVGYEEEAKKAEKISEWRAAVEEGKVSADAFDEGASATPKEWYRERLAEIDAAVEALHALDQVCEERFEDVAPSFLKLRDALQEVRQTEAQLLARKLESDPDPVEEAAPEVIEMVLADESGASADGAASEGALAGAGAPGQPAAVLAGPAPRTLDEAAARLAPIARYLRQQSAADPAPYLMLRGFRWGELRGPDGVIDPRLLAAPPTEVRAQLKALLLDGRWAELLEAAEEVMATPYGRGWLDLQRYVLAACEGLGAEHARIADGVRSALRALLQDFPELPELTLMDDTPTANAETREWLRAEGVLPEAAAETPSPAPRSRVRRTPRAMIEWALERARAGEPDRAIELLLLEAAQEKSPRERFLRRSEAAAVMVEAGFEGVALPILRELLDQNEKHKLDEWESGETTARTLGLLYRCLKKLDQDTSTRDTLYVRICRLDPMQAIQLNADG